MRGAARSASTDSKSGTSDSGSLVSVAHAQHVLGRRRARHDHRAERLLAVPLARGRDRVEEPADARLGIDEVARVHADVEPGEVQPEDLDAPAQRGERPVGDPRAAVRAQAPVEQREILGEPVDRRRTRRRRGGAT